MGSCTCSVSDEALSRYAAKPIGYLPARRCPTKARHADFTQPEFICAFMTTGRRLPAAVAFTVGIGVCVTACFLSLNPQAGIFHIQNTSYEFRFSKITQGTNHVVFSGIPVLARMKRALYESPLRSVCRFVPRGLRTQWYSRTTATNTTVLWVGWTHRDYSYTITNGIPHSLRPDIKQLFCFLSEPGGRTIPLRFFTSSEAPFVKELVEAWELPVSLTN